MKSHEEIKKGLECCSKAGRCMHGCPYYSNSPVCTIHKSRDALAYIRQLEEENEKPQRYCDAEVDRAAEAHYNMREAEKAVPRWISVEERLPEHWHMDDKDRTLINYLVYSPDYGVDVGNYIKSAKRWVCMGLPMNVTHWMPLPEPPEVTK